METGQLLKTRLVLPFSPVNGHLLKSHALMNYCSGLFSCSSQSITCLQILQTLKKKQKNLVGHGGDVIAFHAGLS